MARIAADPRAKGRLDHPGIRTRRLGRNRTLDFELGQTCTGPAPKELANSIRDEARAIASLYTNERNGAVRSGLFRAVQSCQASSGCLTCEFCIDLIVDECGDRGMIQAMDEFIEKLLTRGSYATT